MVLCDQRIVAIVPCLDQEAAVGQPPQREQPGNRTAPHPDDVLSQEVLQPALLPEPALLASDLGGFSPRRPAFGR